MLVYQNLGMFSISQDFFLNFCLCNTIKFEIFICAFTFYCNDTRMIFILFYWSSIWSIFTDLSWYFRTFRFETTLIKFFLRTSATLSFLSKIKSCSTNVILLWVEPFLEKNFFCLPHSLLIAKIHAYGFDKTSTEYLKHYLSNRKLKIKINKTFSNWTNILHGVPQSSILGPLIFNVFFCDLFLFKTNIDLE